MGLGHESGSRGLNLGEPLEERSRRGDLQIWDRHIERRQFRSRRQRSHVAATQGRQAMLPAKQAVSAPLAAAHCIATALLRRVSPVAPELAQRAASTRRFLRLRYGRPAGGSSAAPRRPRGVSGEPRPARRQTRAIPGQLRERTANGCPDAAREAHQPAPAQRSTAPRSAGARRLGLG
jgi:hypothetical protein